MGDKYGYRPYPNEIVAEEFEILQKAARTVSKDTTLLTEWFLRDDNAVPPTYVLQPITSKFPHYNDDSEENEDKRTQVCGLQSDFCSQFLKNRLLGYQLSITTCRERN